MADVDEVKTFIMSIVGIAVLLAIGLIVLSQLSDSVKEDIDATTFTNSSLTWINDTAVSYLDSDCITGTGVCGTLYNDSTNAHTVAADNYTCGTDTLTFLNDGSYYSINSATNSSFLTYTCKEPTTTYTANNSIITKLAGVPTWIGIIIVVALAMIVLGYFYYGKR